VPARGITKVMNKPIEAAPIAAALENRAVEETKPAENLGEKPAVAMAPTAKPAEEAKPAEASPAAAAGLSMPIASDPPGATVTVNGKALDAPTPTTLADLDAKKLYDVSVALKGFHTWKIKLKPKAGDKVDAALVPNEKTVEVSSMPAGAEVSLDGKKVGKTPFVIHRLDVSKSHQLSVKHAGFAAQSRTISAGDAFETKGDRDVLAVAMTLDEEAKAAKPAAAAPPAAKPALAKKPGRAAGEKPAVAEKPTDKPAGSSEEKPAAADKPADTVVEKPVEKPAEKPAAEEKPASDSPALKVPSWMKKKSPAPAAEPGPTENNL
jgi:hypothetical protein